MQKNKNDKFIKIFIKNNNIYSINQEILITYLNNENEISVINNALNSIGKNEYEFECENNKKILKYIDDRIEFTENNDLKKSKLFFKLMLAVGAIVAILIW